MILDVEMPGGNGLAACEMLATDKKFANVPLLILTGRKDEETIRRCHSLGATYVHKCPAAWSKLEPLIRTKLLAAIGSESGSDTRLLTTQ